MLIDKTFFKQPLLYLPQTEALGSGVSQSIKTTDVDFIDEHIEFYEPKFLIKVLGKPLYERFIEEITPVEEEVVEEEENIWLTLKSQLVNTDLLVSPIANYVYFYAIANLTEKTTRQGAVLSKNEASVILSCANKQVAAWNDMVDQLVEFYTWLDENRAVYEEEVKINLNLPFHYENRYL